MTPTHLPDSNVLSWATDLEEKAADQARTTAALPFVSGHLALMPDAHWGNGATVGSVIPTHGAIVPAAVGGDIGCGMIATMLSMKAGGLPDTLDPLLSRIAAVVPAGLGKGHDSRGGDDVRPHVQDTVGWPAVELTGKQKSKAINQFGTLGVGNHFVEVCLSEDDTVWVVLHSGSRGIGHELAKVHIDGAKKLMRQYFIELEDPELAYLVEGTAEFASYIDAMLWAQRYALANRELMMDAVLGQLREFVGADVVELQRINCHHNFTEKEHHHGKNLWITRKGAIRARVGDLGVIPGSMGTATYIVEGLGSPASYESCAHGAGRRMSRGQARRELDLEEFKAQMGNRVWLDVSAEALLDEAPGSYKDVEKVMENQADLVAIKDRLRQILNFKGL